MTESFPKINPDDPLQNKGGEIALEHIAIIMDGNGRWAKSNGKPRFEGHRKGAESVRKTVKSCLKNNIKYLTLYTFSSENWTRPPDEIDSLMGLLKLYISKEVSSLNKNGVKLTFVGDRSKLDQEIQKMMVASETKTHKNTKLNLIIALNYGGREEIVRAAKALASKAINGEIEVNDINSEKISKELYTSEIPDPDLIIRTSGEQRISNFLLWQCAYSEFIFLEKYWPDFDGSSLEEAIEIFKTRDRRYGGTR